ncbi:hypothetical protein MTO96_051455 [Rhipicephalus appendiculatus]
MKKVDHAFDLCEADEISNLRSFYSSYILQGWNDVSFHGSRQIPTPNIDALAANGVVLERHYATPVCTPSRAAFLTGRYPTRVGIGYDPLQPGSKAALSLDFELLPQWLKRQGYSTHMVGKWHLGYKTLEYTPTWRGFDSYLGYYNGEEFYFNHTTRHEGHCGLDLWRNVGHTAQAVTDLNGTYSTYAYTDEAKRIIGRSRQGKSALDVMDHSIGEVLGALQSRGMLADSIVVFASDNGAAPLDELGASNAGSNWPLRGSKKYGVGRRREDPSCVLVRSPEQPFATAALAANDAHHRLGAYIVRSRRYKLVNRSETQSDPQLDSRVHRPEGEPPMELELDSLMKSSEAWRALQQASLDAGASGRSVPRENWRQELIVKCDDSPSSHHNEAVRDNFDPYDTTFVFDIISDPCELNNLASSEPELRDRLLKKLATFRTQIPIDPMTTDVDERGFPEHHQCTWSTWLDVEPAEYQSCPC